MTAALTHRAVVVTGCSSGLGLATAEALCARGHRVLATWRSEPMAAGLTRLAAAHPGRVELLQVDVTSPDDVSILAHKAEELGVAHVVNNAGGAWVGAFENTTDEQLRAQLEVNVLGAARVTRALLPLLRQSKGGVTFVGSSIGLVSLPSLSAYCASKAALEGLAESLYWELRPLGVRVHILEPGGHRTDLARNFVWAEGEVPAYKALTQRHRALADSYVSGRRRGASPKKVAKKAVQLIEGRSTRLRVPVGFDAHLALWLRALPDGLRRALMAPFIMRTFWGRQGAAG